MHATLPLLARTDFPALRRRTVETLQINLGYRCNQSCQHCHVNAGPNRTRGRDEDESEPVLLGDVVLCPPVAATQAKQHGHSTQAELELLTVHGVLHLLGYDHADPEEEAEMFSLQSDLLRDWREQLASGPPSAGGGREGQA